MGQGQRCMWPRQNLSENGNFLQCKKNNIIENIQQDMYMFLEAGVNSHLSRSL